MKVTECLPGSIAGLRLPPPVVPGNTEAGRAWSSDGGFGEMKFSGQLRVCDHEPVDVLVQWVRAYWTKRSRGAPGAIRRSALPEAFPLPHAAVPFVHEVRMSECDDFTPHPTVTSGLPPAAEVELTEAGGVVTVLLVRDASGWPPARPPAWRPAAVDLRPGQTLRWQVNYRFTTEEGWYYRLDTLNVCCGTGPAGVFLDRPACRIDERARLR